MNVLVLFRHFKNHELNNLALIDQKYFIRILYYMNLTYLIFPTFQLDPKILHLLKFEKQKRPSLL